MPLKIFLVVGGLLVLGAGGWFFLNQSTTPAGSNTPPIYGTGQESDVQEPVSQSLVDNLTSAPTASETPKVNTETASVDLLSLADNKYANGEVPLGDYKYSTAGPKKGYVYLCNSRKDGGGAQAAGPWINGSTWNLLEKISVAGAVSWPNAAFSALISGVNRVLSGNGLPKNHTTGTFPVASNDPAYAYDRNPNSIKTQTLSVSIPKNPVYSETPYCMGGEVGVMLSGVPLFNAFDATLRDAVANEVQDSCGGHPQVSGQYHYHGLSPCFKDVSVETVLGFAFDGFPITGPKVAENKYLTTEDLDICHGIESEIMLDGKRTKTYHYVMTQDFPYSVGCFRGKPATMGVSSGGGAPSGTVQPTQGSGMQGGGTPSGNQPPAEAQAACSGKSNGATCSFVTPMGNTISGTCSTPGGVFACLPQ
ncbi:YHYH protein [Patescibacteria group bacterium]|nr:YHYH protein [Patescibacteria group bacterium]